MLKPWQKTVNDSMEIFGCCSSHRECTEAHNCVKKEFHINYNITCSLYKHIKKKVVKKIKKVKKVKKVKK